MHVKVSEDGLANVDTLTFVDIFSPILVPLSLGLLYSSAWEKEVIIL